MANCTACEEIRHIDPDLIVNGFDSDNCTSLQNDTGLVASSGHDDATDLTNLNDCFVGNMDDEVEKYEVCDWKEFMHKFLPNLWTVLSAIICAIKGLWTNVHNLWTDIRNLHQDIATINNNISSISNNVTTINNTVINMGQQIATMPKNIIYADVAAAAIVQSGYPAGEVNRVNIPCGRADGYIPIGIVGWNLSNNGSDTGVSRIYPFKVKLMGDYVSLQLRNMNDTANSIIVEATVIYMQI